MRRENPLISGVLGGFGAAGLTVEARNLEHHDPSALNIKNPGTNHPKSMFQLSGAQSSFRVAISIMLDSTFRNPARLNLDRRPRSCPKFPELEP